MSTVPLYDAKNRLSELIDAIQRGGEISITRRGVPVARLLPAASQKPAQLPDERAAAAFRRMRALRSGRRLDGEIKRIAREGLD